MKITNLEELKEATKWASKYNLDRKLLALRLMAQAKEYKPRDDQQFQCGYCLRVNSWGGTCITCGEEMFNMDDLELEEV